MDQKRDQLTDRAHQLYYQAQQNAPNSRQILGLVTLLLAGGLLLLLGGLALTGTTITALLATPVDDVRQRLSETASQIKEKAREYGSEAKEYVQSRTDTSVAA